MLARRSGIGAGWGHVQRTSSLLVCFWRLALIEEAPASLVPVGVLSSTGRGIPEGPGLLAKGMAPRPWRLGVPRRVPGLTDMMAWLLESWRRPWECRTQTLRVNKPSRRVLGTSRSKSSNAATRSQ